MHIFSLAVSGTVALLPSGFLLVVVLFFLIVLLLLLHLLPVVHLVLPEALIEVLILPTLAVLGRALRITAPRLSSTASNGISPASGCLTCVHFREEQAKHCLAVRPIEIVELNGDLLLRLGRCLLTLVVLLRELAARLDERQEFWLLVALFCRHFCLKLSPLLLLDLLHRLEEELLDVAALVEDHLTYLFKVAALLVLLSDALVKIAELLMLLSHDLLVLELEQLALLLKVGYDLAKTLLEQVDLRLEQLDLFRLFKLTLSVFLHRKTLLVQFVFGLIVV